MKKLSICYLLHFIFIISFTTKLSAQIHNPHFLHLTTNDGLANNRVKAIFQDSKGFIWFGTDDGLSRYDGYQFKTYSFTPFDSCSLRGHFITAITQDKQGKLWIGTFNEGVYSFDPVTECFQHLPVKHLDQTEDGGVLKIYIDKQEMLWLITEHLIIKRFDLKTKKIESFGKKRAFRPPSYVEEDRSGRYMFLDIQGKDVEVFDKQQLKFIRHKHAASFKRPEGYNTQSVIKDTNKKLWLYRSNAQELQRVDLATGEITTFSEPSQAKKTIANAPQPSPFQSFIFRDNQGLVWKTNRYGLLAYDPAQKKFIKNYPVQGKQKNLTRINAVLVAKSGVVWLGTETGAYMLNFRANQLQTFTASGLGGIMETVYEDSEGTVWVGGEWTMEAFPANSSASVNFIKYYKKKFPDIELRPVKICEDPEGKQDHFWLSVTERGLIRFDKLKRDFTRYSPKDTSNHLIDVYDILPDKGNTLWLACNNGLQKFNTQDHTFQWYKHNPNDPESVPAGTIQTVYKDRQGFLWVGTRENGMARFDESAGKFSRHTHHPKQRGSLSNNSVNAFYEDGSGNFWVATSGGLNMLDREKRTFRHFTRKDGLPNNKVFGILEDQTRKLWLSTRNGISRFDPVNKTFTNYDERDGLLNNELSLGAYYKNKQGKMFFGGFFGVTAFYPEQLGNNCYTPPVVITKFKKINQEIPLHEVLSPEGKLTLSYKDEVVSFEIAALSFYNAYKNQYAYKLEGLHEDWIQLGTRREITLTSLDPGSYTLRVKASNNDGVWNEEGMTLQIQVVPPFWATWWFRSGISIFIIGLIIAICTVRINSIKHQKKLLALKVEEKTIQLKEQTIELQKANKTKDQFFAIIAHDLRGPLTSFQETSNLIHYFLEKNRPEKIRQLGDRINQAAKGLNGLLNNLLNWAMVQQKTISYHPTEISLKSLVDECLATYTGSIQIQQIEIHTTIDEDLCMFADYNTALSIVRNLVNNAIKYTPEHGYIEIQGYQAYSNVILSVKDSGIGMSKQILEQIFDVTKKRSRNGLRGETGSGLGLILCKEFAKLNKATLTVNSIPDKGSTFYLTFQDQPNELITQHKTLSHTVLSK